MGKQRLAIIPTERIERAIIVVRGEKVMLDRDLALLYGVSDGWLSLKEPGLSTGLGAQVERE